MHEVVTTARTLGLEVTPVEVSQALEIFSSLEQLRDRIDALYITTDPLIFSNRGRITAMAEARRLPIIVGAR